MSCPKCQGFIITEYGARRCLNCGCQPDVELRPAVSGDGGEEDDSERCSKCRKTAPVLGRKMCRPCLDSANDKVVQARFIEKGVTTMPRFKTEEGRQRWLAAMAKRRGEKNARGGAVSTAVALHEPEAVTVRPRVVNGSVVDALDQAILELESDKAALERAKEILERR